MTRDIEVVTNTREIGVRLRFTFLLAATAVLASIAILAAPASAQGTSTGTIAGTLESSSAADPLPYVVDLQLSLLTTGFSFVGVADIDDAGNYSVDVEPGTYNLSTFVPGFFSALETVTVVQGQTVTVDFEIDRNPTSTAVCLLYTSPSPRDKRQSRMPSSA